VERSFSLVLGCDGTHSALRRMCFGEESNFLLYLQNYFSLTIVDKLLIEEDTSQMFNVPGKTVMLNAHNKKTDIAFCFFSEDEIAYDRRSQDQQKDMIRQHFNGEGWRITELLDEMVRCDNFYFDKLCQIRMPSWSKGRVALVGDAAYCPSPAAGMGGSMAILGAAALADALHKYPVDLSRAFQEYDESFRPTVEAIQTAAIDIGLAMFMPRTEEAIQRRNMQLNAF
jgi:2-polyprenyl-6-methoxyphenol hydroxylase-like FAD-dependent oxidoreductase